MDDAGARAAGLAGEAGSRLSQAAAFAIEAHGGQLRKGTTIPYASHLLAVAAAVLELGGDVEQAMAALLHDVLEDCEAVTVEELRGRFGPDVASMVEDCTDTLDGDSAQRKSPWRERKTRYLAHLARSHPRTALVSGCDKAHNLDSINADVAEHGIATLERFNAGPEELLWYYASIRDALEDRVPPRLARRLREGVEQFERSVLQASR